MCRCRGLSYLARVAMSGSVSAGLAIVLLAAPVLSGEEPRRGRLIGTVTVLGANEPVVGARIRVLTGHKDDIGVQYVPIEATSDATGRYQLELPIGHGQLSPPVLPPGCWLSLEGYTAFATTPEQPEHTKNYQVQRGPTCRVHIGADKETVSLLPGVRIFASRSTEPYIYIDSSIDESGLGLLTLPEIGGEFQVSFVDSTWQLMADTPAKLSVSPGFQPQRVTGMKRNENNGFLTFEDDTGHRATLTGSDGAVVDGCLEIRFRASSPSAEETFAVSGRVVEDKGQPIANAIVALGSGKRTGGSSMTLLNAHTDDHGRFTISRLRKAVFTGSDQQLLLMVKRDGFAGVDTKYRPIPKDAGDEPIDFGTITLQPGHQARLRVVDPDGKPVLGAWVEPGASYAARAELTRTDGQGRCTLRNLAPGVQRVDIRFGEMYANAKVVVVPGDTDETLVRLRPLQVPTATTIAAKPQKPLAAGEEMLEWDVVGWTDGVQRKLSDYRGKVVVIDVWGVWCSPCINAIPGLKEIQQQFRDRDVVFLGIHTAGTDLNQIRKLMEFKEWNWPTGLDAGEETNSGSTVQRYGVRGFPTTIVVSRDGKVAFNTDTHTGDRDAVMKEVEQTARELDIAWPIPEVMSEEDGIALVNRMLVHRLSKQIEAALRAE